MVTKYERLLKIRRKKKVFTRSMSTETIITVLDQKLSGPKMFWKPILMKLDQMKRKSV